MRSNEGTEWTVAADAGCQLLLDVYSRRPLTFTVATTNFQGTSTHSVPSNPVLSAAYGTVALAFPRSARAVLPAPPALNSATAFTVECWVKFDALEHPPESPIVCQGALADPEEAAKGLQLCATTNTPGYVLRFGDGVKQVRGCNPPQCPLYTRTGVVPSVRPTGRGGGDGWGGYKGKKKKGCVPEMGLSCLAICSKFHCSLKENFLVLVRGWFGLGALGPPDPPPPPLWISTSRTCTPSLVPSTALHRSE